MTQILHWTYIFILEETENWQRPLLNTLLIVTNIKSKNVISLKGIFQVSSICEIEMVSQQMDTIKSNVVWQ